ncbi:MAG: PIN domain-containing protein [Anaerolineae bacterium]|nr:PIN domain-containing protein [Anaerolineae bacterium]
MPAPHRPRVFIDADVLFAGSASPSDSGASLVVLRMAEITLIDAYTCRQVIVEVERNLAAKLPRALPAFRMIVARCVAVVDDPSTRDLKLYTGLADATDLPILVAALEAGCPWLVSFNTRHYQPGHPDVTVLPPGDFLLRVRDRLTLLG